MKNVAVVIYPQALASSIGLAVEMLNAASELFTALPRGNGVEAGRRSMPGDTLPATIARLATQVAASAGELPGGLQASRQAPGLPGSAKR